MVELTFCLAGWALRCSHDAPDGKARELVLTNLSGQPPQLRRAPGPTPLPARSGQVLVAK